MWINPVATNTKSPNFQSLKYQNGIRTKAALSPELTNLLKRYDSVIDGMKNIDILAFDDGILRLFVRTPRFLNEKYERFYKDKDYIIDSEEGDSCVRLYSQQEFWNGYMSYYNIKNKLVPAGDMGVYNVEAGTTYLGDYIPTTDWKQATPIRTLEVAKLLDSILQDIDDAETRYGMNCVEVLDNADQIRYEETRQNIINQIQSSYTTNDGFTKLSDNNLLILLGNKQAADELKHYSLVIDESECNIYIKDDQGLYLDEIFDKYYNEQGWTLIRTNNGFKLQSLRSKDFYYTLGDLGDRTYNIYYDHYEGGCHTSSICSDEGLKDLLKLAKILDDVAEAIEADQSKNG